MTWTRTRGRSRSPTGTRWSSSPTAPRRTRKRRSSEARAPPAARLHTDRAAGRRRGDVGDPGRRGDGAAGGVPAAPPRAGEGEPGARLQPAHRPDGGGAPAGGAGAAQGHPGRRERSVPGGHPPGQPQRHRLLRGPGPPQLQLQRDLPALGRSDQHPPGRRGGAQRAQRHLRRLLRRGALPDEHLQRALLRRHGLRGRLGVHHLPVGAGQVPGVGVGDGGERQGRLGGAATQPDGLRQPAAAEVPPARRGPAGRALPGGHPQPRLRLHAGPRLLRAQRRDGAAAAVLVAAGHAHRPGVDRRQAVRRAGERHRLGGAGARRGRAELRVPRRGGRDHRRAGAGGGSPEDPPGGDHLVAAAGAERGDHGDRSRGRHRLRHGAPVSRTPRGYSMLAALLIVVALIAIAAAVVQLGGSARQISAGERDHQQALAIAELGLERTRAYLLQMSLTDVDFYRALDPNLDTTCSLPSAPILDLGGGQADDHLPPFTGTGVAPITLAATSGKTFLQVPIAGGSYLVRIDDNEDDEDGTFSSSTSNNATGGCVEGLTLLTAKENPVRDRDRTVIVTVIGLYPGTDPLKARATRTLRTEVGPAKSAGIYAGGDVSMGGASKACGEYADLST